MPTLKENIDRINNLSKELNVEVSFDKEYKCLFIKSTKKGSQRIRRVIDLSMDNVEAAMYWVARRSPDS